MEEAEALGPEGRKVSAAWRSLNTLAVTAISAGRRRLGALLVADGLVSQHQIEAALARQQVERRRLGDVLVREELVSEADLVEALAAQLRLEVADLDQVYFSPETLAFCRATS